MKREPWTCDPLFPPPFPCQCYRSRATAAGVERLSGWHLDGALTLHTAQSTKGTAMNARALIPLVAAYLALGNAAEVLSGPDTNEEGASVLISSPEERALLGASSTLVMSEVKICSLDDTTDDGSLAERVGAIQRTIVEALEPVSMAVADFAKGRAEVMHMAWRRNRGYGKWMMLPVHAEKIRLLLRLEWEARQCLGSSITELYAIWKEVHSCGNDTGALGRLAFEGLSFALSRGRVMYDAVLSCMTMLSYFSDYKTEFEPIKRSLLKKRARLGAGKRLLAKAQAEHAGAKGALTKSTPKRKKRAPLRGTRESAGSAAYFLKRVIEEGLST